MQKYKKYFLAGIIIKAIYIVFAISGLVTIFINEHNVEVITLTSVSNTTVYVLSVEIIGLIISISRFLNNKCVSNLSIVASFVTLNIPSGVLFLISKTIYKKNKEKENETI
ncbi:hypothetical protein [Spiroplasma monobiae]|uniref:Uncharacterized protein n=1 Tax=Spiroplasma monobiae MQ-1 TaxID=1336748 RepID=A0A2K9LUR7_SPISQ|nr:hypothetical protein [Spiroplasma monobiae]AUM62792.1 hypothetical protein SMONO_v1c05430 [Spiroplasma monobiae MQ-1]